MVTVAEDPTRTAVLASELGPIVLAVDASRDAELAARAAAGIATQAGLTVHVVHAWSLAMVAVPYGFYLPSDDGEADERAGRRLVDDVASRLESAGVRSVVRHAVFGRAADTILNVAHWVGAGHIVMGSRGLGAVSRLVLGSVSEEVVHRSHRAVLVTRGGPDAWPPSRVVIGDDGSEIAMRAARVGAAIAGVLAIPASTTTVLPEIPESVTSAAGISVDTVLTSALRPVEERTAQLSTLSGVAVDARIAFGEAAAVLVDEAADGARCLLVVGTRELGAFARTRHGSVSSKVLHAAEGSVLVVPPSADEAPDPASS